MGYDIRPLATLATQARQFFVQAIPGAVVDLLPNTFRVLGKVLALSDFEHEQRRAWLFRQLFASTAEEQWLTRHGFELGLVPNPGRAATGTIRVPVLSDVLVPAGLTFARLDGVTYTTLAPAASAGGAVDLPIEADEPGAAYQAAAGDTLSLVADNAVPFGLGDTATVLAPGLTGAVEPEEIEAFRARVLYRKRNPPQGGSAADYTEWAGEALASLKAVFVDSFVNDARAVWVCFTVTDQPGNVPDAAEVATVQDYLSDPIRRPITARVYAVAPTPVPVPVAIRNLSPDTVDTRAAIAAELDALQEDEMQPATPSGAFVLYREEIEAAINRATGVRAFTLQSPTGDLTFTTPGQLPVLQDPTYS